MDSILDFLFLRRLRFEYTTPPICPIALASASGLAISGQVISPILAMNAPRVIGRFLTWPCAAGQICYNIYSNASGLLTEVATCIQPNSVLVCSAGCWRAAAVINGAEGPLTDPVCTEGTPTAVDLPAQPGASYNLYFNANPLDPFGTYELVLSAFFCGAFETCTPGCYSISAITGDGETPPSDPACTSNAQPEIFISSPTAGELFYACAPSVNVTAAVTPNEHSIDNVQFFDGATLLGTATAEPYSITWAGGAYGTHSLTATVNYGAHSITSAAVAVEIQKFTPKTEDWAIRVVSNGGTRPVDATLCAIDVWYQGLLSAGLDSLMLSACVFKNDNRYAAATPFFNSAGLDPWTMVRIIPDTGTEVIDNGMRSNLLSKPYCDTGCVPSVVYPSNLDAGFTLYAYDASDSGNEYTAGCSDGGFANAVALDNTGLFGPNVLFGTVCGQGPSVASGPFKGFLSMNRNAATTTMYQANSTLPHTIFGSPVASIPGTLTGQSFYFFNMNILGGPGFYSLATMSFAAIHRSMTQSQNATFYNLTQALLQTLGGGYR